MTRVAEAECATCHLIRPKNEMREVRLRRKAGSSFGFWQSATTGNNGRQNNRRGNSYHSSYAHSRVWVCHGCKKPKSDWTPFHFLALAMIALLGWALLSPTKAKKGEGAKANALGQPTTLANPEANDVESSQAPELAPDGNAIESDIEANAPGDAQTRNFNFELTEIQAAQVKAAKKGEPVRWKVGGLSGYAVPSLETTTDETGALCRSVYAALDNSEEKSSIVRICEEQPGTWVVR